MECPQCGNRLKIPEVAKLNMESYGNSALVKTECCGQAVMCYPETVYTAKKYHGNKTADDWGNKFS